MGDVHSVLAFQPMRCMASGVECELPGTPTQKSNAASVSDAHKEVQVQSERIRTSESPVTAAVLITKLDLVRRAVEDLAQFLTFKKHVAWGLLWCLLSR
jgi:hypothetical protein